MSTTVNSQQHLSYYVHIHNTDIYAFHFDTWTWKNINKQFSFYYYYYWNDVLLNSIAFNRMFPSWNKTKKKHTHNIFDEKAENKYQSPNVKIKNNTNSKLFEKIIQFTSFGSCGDASFLARLIFFTLLHESISSGRLT